MARARARGGAGYRAGDPGLGLLGQGVRDGLAGGKARDGGAGIAEQDPAGAVPVQQGSDDSLRRQVVQPQGPQAFLVRRRQGLAIQQPSRQLGDADIAGLLGQKGVIVPPAVGVKQAQAAEVPGVPQLLRGGREQQDAGSLGGEGGHQVVCQAGLGGAPAQVMGLVQDQQVPVGLQHRPGRGGGGQQPLQGTEGLRLGEEGVVAGGRDLAQPLAVEEGEAQIEAPPHLHQPLVEQGLGDQDQGPRHPPGEEQLVEDEAGLDGLAQAHLVRQQHPGGRAAGDLGSDIELMGDGADPGPHQAQYLGSRRRHPPQPGLVAQAEPGITVEARGQQALAGPVDRQGGIDPGLGEPAGVAFRVLALVGERCRPLPPPPPPADPRRQGRAPAPRVERGPGSGARCSGHRGGSRRWRERGCSPGGPRWP
jgi:hypothetical protein